MKNNRFLYLFVLSAFCLLLSAAPSYSFVKVKASVDKNKITIGDKIIYTLALEYDSKTQLKVPEMGANLGEFEIKDYKITGPKNNYNLKKFRRDKTVSYRYTLTTFTTGEFLIPDAGIRYTDGSGEEKEVKSGEITVFVESVGSTKKDRDDIRDVKPPLGIPRGWLFYFLLIAGPLLLAGGWFGYSFYKNRKTGGIFAETDLNRPADEVAYERLKKLEELDLFRQGKIKEYYIILSEIIRSYIERRFSISVLDRTTNELYRELRELPEIDKKHCSIVKDFLEESDLVKFAKYIPDESIIIKDTETARKIVDLTKIVQSSEFKVHG